VSNSFLDKRMFWQVLDFVFPWPEPLPKKIDVQGSPNTEADWKSRLALLGDDEQTLEKYLEQCQARLEVEKSRTQSVESRLTSIIGLSSIAGTIVFGSILALAAGSFRPAQASLRWIISFGAFYLTLQLGSAILAAVQGLSRRHYNSESPSDVLPMKDEVRPVYLHRRIGSKIEEAVDLQEKNNPKVTHMAVAHRATTNFVVALMVFALVSAVYGILPSSSNDVVETLKKNHELLDMVKGLPGPVGSPGLPGPQGPPGPKGVTRRCPCLKIPEGNGCKVK
jgi:hypothetical protein